MQKFFVTGAHHAPALYRMHGVTHAVSFRDHTFEHPTLDGIPDENRARYYMYDRYFEPGTVEHDDIGRIVQHLIEWTRALPEDAVVGFNCFMGISRSTAACLIACVVRFGFNEGSALFFNEVGRRGCAPNEVMLEHADAALGLEGRLVSFGDSVYTYYAAMYPEGLVPHRKNTQAPPHDPWDIKE